MLNDIFEQVNVKMSLLVHSLFALLYILTGRGCDNSYLKLPKISGGREGTQGHSLPPPKILNVHFIKFANSRGRKYQN